MNPPSASPALTALLGVLLALTAFGLDSFLPAMPALAESLDASPRAVQLAVTSYLAGVAGGQLFWGPFSDRFGRRPALFAGLALFCGASAACASAASVGGVIALRFVQGLGLASGPVVSRSVVRDLVAHEHAGRLLSRMMVVFCLIPILAPLIGGALAGIAWQAVLWFHAGAAALLLLASHAGLAETAPAIGQASHPAELARRFAGLLKDRRFTAPLAILLCTYVGIVAFVSASAFVLVQGYGVTPALFSVLFAAVMVGHISGTWSSSRLVLARGIPWMVRVGAALSLGAAVMLAALTWLGVQHWLSIVLPLVLFMFGTGFLIANAMAAALSPFPEIAGSASALMGCLQFATGAIASALLAALFDGTGRPMATFILLAAIGAVLAERFLFRPWQA